jgi:hypothetical protein
MPHPHARRLVSGIAVAATLTLTACTPAELTSLLGAASPDRPAASGDTASSKPPADPAADARFAAFQAKVEAASGDPGKIAKLFVAALAYYGKDATLAKEMMTAACGESELSVDPSSRSGFSFIPARGIYWAGVDRQPTLGQAYLAPGAIDGANPEDTVVIDDDYNALDKGVQGDRAHLFIALQDGSGKRPRPITVTRADGKWRVTDFSSIVVPI